MEPQALVAASAAVPVVHLALLSTAACALVLMLAHRLTLLQSESQCLEDDVRRADAETERANAATRIANGDVVANRKELAAAHGRLEHAAERLAELEDELQRARGPLVGQLVVVNTPRPDDQSIRGVITAQLDDGGFVLAGAELLETIRDRGGDQVVEQQIGDVVVPRYSWLQRLKPED
jgi:hypothetical protein